jgi:methylamine---glutamate N-methyltransferase subunit B
LPEPLKILLQNPSAQKLAEVLRQHSAGRDSEGAELDIELTEASGQDFIGSGLRCASSVRVHGNVGDFAFCSFGEGQVDVSGNAGMYLGHSLHSGVVVLQGTASDHTGALATGGTIAVNGNSGDRLGTGLQGAEIVVRGSVGLQAGFAMQSGAILIGGNAGKGLGFRIAGGTIYLRGDAESLSPDVEEHRLREPDKLKISLLMLKAGLQASNKEFRVYRSVHAPR